MNKFVARHQLLRSGRDFFYVAQVEDPRAVPMATCADMQRAELVADALNLQATLTERVQFTAGALDNGSPCQ